jgi:hypothetical protein
MRTISVDFHVWKALTGRLTDETDTYNAVLRRVLGLGEQPPESLDDNGAGTDEEHPASGRPWVTKGAKFPQGTEFRLHYKGVTYSARAVDGSLELQDGRRFSSPSKAAGAITKTSVNGWRMWEYREPGGAGWKPLWSARPGAVQIDEF